MTADNALKVPLGRSLSRLAQNKALDAINVLGKSLPASVVAVVSSGIVTVKFEITSPFTIPNVTCPIFGPEYIRYPTQVGDLGVVFPVDVYVGGVSGLGGGVADLTQRSTLATLVFFPIGNKNWSPPTDPNKIEIYGPDGAIIRDKQNTTSLTAYPSGNGTGHGLKIVTSGGAVLELPLVQAANDAAAAALGVPINGLYHNSNGVLIRLI